MRGGGIGSGDQVGAKYLGISFSSSSSTKSPSDRTRLAPAAVAIASQAGKIPTELTQDDNENALT